MNLKKLTIEEKITNSLSLQSIQRFLQIDLKLKNISSEYLFSEMFKKNILSSWDENKKTLFFRKLAGPINYKEVKKYYTS